MNMFEIIVQFSDSEMVPEKYVVRSTGGIISRHDTVAEAIEAVEAYKIGDYRRAYVG